MTSVFWRQSQQTDRYQTAVSLHGHTQESRESLDFIPRYAQLVPGVATVIRRKQQHFHQLYGKPLNFADAWWTPPLSPREAFQLESRSIADDLGRTGLVSLTDHDDIEAPMHLRILPEARCVPVSVEWSVPWGQTFFHLGIHNLQARRAHSIMDELSAWTRAPRASGLPDLLDGLCSDPDVLVVLNHPLWDERGIGQEQHFAAITQFVQLHRQWLHAAELNGLRDWRENAAVITFARRMGLTLISGGDRHGCEPNAIVNLTSATQFTDFVAEVRRERRTAILFRDHYREPFRMRILQGLLDAIRDYPEFPQGRRRWTDRVFFRHVSGLVQPISEVWEGDGPAIVKLFVNSVRLLDSKPVQNALRFALSEQQEEVAI